MGAAQKSFDNPDETRTFDKGKVEIVNLDTHTVGRATFEPGWKWSECVKPIAGTESCEAHHVGVVLAGSLHVVLDDGTEMDTTVGGAYEIPPGHDAWVTSDEPAILLEVQSETAQQYAKS
jgi:hypothetical protein